MTEPVLSLDRVRVVAETLTIQGAVRTVVLLDGVSLRVPAGGSVAVTAERGAGRTTLARVAAGLTSPTSGGVTCATGELSRSVRLVPHEPERTLRVGATVEEAIRGGGLTRRSDVAARERAAVIDLLVELGGDDAMLTRPVGALSLVDRRRVALARALIGAPDVLVLDDITEGLAPTERGQLADILHDLREHRGLSLLVADRDPAFAAESSHELAVLHLGRIVEVGPSAGVVQQPQHPYTQALLGAVPIPSMRREAGRRRPRLTGPRGDLLAPPPGCRLHPRCWRADQRCHDEQPALSAGEGVPHAVACHHPGPGDPLP